MSGRDWGEAAREAAEDDLREAILTGYKQGKPFTPYVPTLRLLGPVESVLDFGCGLGRNFPYLIRIAREVVGYDLPAMVERCRELAPVAPSSLTSDWNGLASRRFDLIFAALVIQHIPLDSARSYLSDFASMAPHVYLLTRLRSDFGGSVVDMVLETGAFDITALAEVEHDPRTHQLVSLGERTIDDLRGMDQDRHVEAVLRSRRTSAGD